jgi:transposase-like protein
MPERSSQNEAQPIFRRANNQDFERSRGRCQGVTDLCRKHGFSEQSFYRWKSKYGGLGITEAKRLKILKEENRRLKKAVADLTLDNQILKRAERKKRVKPAELRDRLLELAAEGVRFGYRRLHVLLRREDFLVNC